jgi:hypothetical protein
MYRPDKLRLYELRRDTYAPRGRCTFCGSTDRLVWDHIDPSTKEFDVMHGLLLSPERIEAEIAKCRVLCNDCNIRRAPRYKLQGHMDEIAASSESSTVLAMRFGVSPQAIRLARKRHRELQA